MLAQFRTTWGLAAAVLVGLGLLFVAGLALLRPPVPPPPTKRSADAEHEEALEQARDLLAKASHAAACRAGLQQLNVRLAEHPELRPEPLTGEQRRQLREQFGLTDEEL